MKDLRVKFTLYTAIQKVIIIMSASVAIPYEGDNTVHTHVIGCSETTSRQCAHTKRYLLPTCYNLAIINVNSESGSGSTKILNCMYMNQTDFID